MSKSGIIDLQIGSPLFLHNGEEINESIWSLNVKQRQIFDYIFTCVKKKETENFNQTQGSEAI